MDKVRRKKKHRALDNPSIQANQNGKKRDNPTTQAQRKWEKKRLPQKTNRR